MFKDNFQLHPNEHVIKYVRRHWVFFVWDCVAMGFLFLVPAVIVWTLEFSGFLPEFNLLGVSFASFLNIVVYLWGLFCWLQLAEKFTDNILDFWIVTNKRIIESELKGLFNRRLSTLELQDIEDITISDPGFLANYFGYGTLEVQTAGAVQEFKAENVENPEEVQKVMFDAKLADEDERKSFQRKSIEQVTQEVVHEEVEPQFLHESHPESHIPVDQKRQGEDGFDWALKGNTEDERDRNTKLEQVEDKYKNNLGSAVDITGQNE